MCKERFFLFHKELFPAMLLSSLNSILSYSFKPHLPLTISLTGPFICYRRLLFLFPSSSFLLSLSFTTLFFPQLFLLFVCCLNPFTPSPPLISLYFLFLSSIPLLHFFFSFSGCRWRNCSDCISRWTWCRLWWVRLRCGRNIPGHYSLFSPLLSSPRFRSVSIPFYFSIFPSISLSLTLSLSTSSFLLCLNKKTAKI